MTDLERDLYWELARTVKLLGGKSDILGALEMMDSAMPQAEAVEETYRLVNCWNNSAERKLDEIPNNLLYQVMEEYPCNSE